MTALPSTGTTCREEIATGCATGIIATQQTIAGGIVTIGTAAPSGAITIGFADAGEHKHLTISCPQRPGFGRGVLLCWLEKTTPPVG